MITDNVEWGVGWMWDDGTNRLMPKFSAYNLDGNIATYDISVNAEGKTTIETDSDTVTLNTVKKGNSNNI